MNNARGRQTTQTQTPNELYEGRGKSVSIAYVSVWIPPVHFIYISIYYLYSFVMQKIRNKFMKWYGDVLYIQNELCIYKVEARAHTKVQKRK